MIRLPGALFVQLVFLVPFGEPLRCSKRSSLASVEGDHEPLGIQILAG